MSPLTNPREPVRRTTGKNAAWADAYARIGGSKLALGIRDIGAALQQVCGQAGGNGGRLQFPSRASSAASSKLVGISPTRIAMAFSSSTRRLSNAASSTSVVASSVSARATSEFVADAAVETAAREAHEFLSQLDLADDRGQFAVQGAEPKIVLRQIGLQGKQHLVHGRERTLRVSPRAFEAPAHAAPEIDLIAEIERRAESVHGDRAEARLLVWRVALAPPAWVGVECGQKFTPRYARRSPRLFDARDRCPEFLVHHARALLQLVQRLVAKHFPPCALRHVVEWLALLPGAEIGLGC